MGFRGNIWSRRSPIDGFGGKVSMSGSRMLGRDRGATPSGFGILPPGGRGSKRRIDS